MLQLEEFLHRQEDLDSLSHVQFGATVASLRLRWFFPAAPGISKLSISAKRAASAFIRQDDWDRPAPSSAGGTPLHSVEVSGSTVCQKIFDDKLISKSKLPPGCGSAEE